MTLESFNLFSLKIIAILPECFLTLLKKTNKYKEPCYPFWTCVLSVWEGGSRITRADIQSIFLIFLSFFSALQHGSQLYHYCKTSQRPNKKYLHGQSSTSVLSTTRHTGTLWRSLFFFFCQLRCQLCSGWNRPSEDYLTFFLIFCVNWGMFHLFEVSWMVPSLSYGVTWGL